ncbi:MAG: hypothetical protein K2G35_02325 [Duncaniella sp.]|nr:hypothetical protein [Duncaniella sp.]
MLLDLTYTFNRWLKMLGTYGRLDATTLPDDLSKIARFLELRGIRDDIKEAAKLCRDYALSDTNRFKHLTRSLSRALSLMCEAQEDTEVRKIRKAHADQGMREKYRPLSRRLAKEKIRKIGKAVIFTDPHTDSAETTKLVRRIVEKRAAQEVHKNAGKHSRKSNLYRHDIQRAVSFNLYNTRYVEYDAELRAHGTHWRVLTNFRKGEKMLVAKNSYNTYDEAVEACVRIKTARPDDQSPMSAYRCDHCGKWHIGHARFSVKSTEVPSDEKKETDKKIAG